MSHDKPLIDSVSAGYLAQIVNRVAAAFDVAALSSEEIIVLQVLLERFDDALWQAHGQALQGAYRDVVEHPEAYEGDDDDDDDDGSGGVLH
jgi:hypothetical protein